MIYDLDFSEDSLVEQPSIKLLSDLGWDFVNCIEEVFPSSGRSKLGRETRRDVLLLTRLEEAIRRLNPGLESTGISAAVHELRKDRSSLQLVRANQEIHRLMIDGIRVEFRDQDGNMTSENVRIIDWDDVKNNDFLLTSQLWIAGEMYTRRADLIGFVNGIPLVFIELKATHRNVKNAYDENLRDYKNTIPHLFWYNAFLILSNGSESKIGTITSGWEHFTDWKRIADESEDGLVSLDTMLRGTCAPNRLLDLTESFSIFMDVQDGTIKILAKNHQYLGVNKAFLRFKNGEITNGQAGVFWHTQGSGKSISMIMFSQKILRKIPGNWSFVIVTDRTELDNQISKNFKDSGCIRDTNSRAESASDLRQLLTENHRYVFTLIQKFRADEPGQVHPTLSEREDIIVIVDEAHRSQYDVFALNMRTALPNAHFMAFTGTPLIAGEGGERTKEVFGEYVSVYNFRQSIEDGATVALYYENRIPELQLVVDNLDDEIYKVVDEAGLDDAQEKKLEREFARQYHLITRKERLDAISHDLVNHFVERGHRGKAMVVSIDKATAIRTFDMVQKHWEQKIRDLEDSLHMVGEHQKPIIEDTIQFMRSTEMAVVVSQSQNEVEDMLEKGLDIIPHRLKMIEDDLDRDFKNTEHPFRLVFLCAMWMTGFDVPNCSTIYLDKPLRNHTLMQTIARANRVYAEKSHGLIVDYVGVFRNLNKALAIYGASHEGEGIGGSPVESKAALVEMLSSAVNEAEKFLSDVNVSIPKILESSGFERIAILDDAIENILIDDQHKMTYQHVSSTAIRIWKAILPDSQASEFTPKCVVLKVLKEKIRALTPPADISEVMQSIDDVLDVSIATDGYMIDVQPEENLVDLAQIDFDGLKERFSKGRQRTELERLRVFIARKIGAMVQLNRSRLDFHERFEQMIKAYNQGTYDTQTLFDMLLNYVEELQEEEVRHVKEGLTEEELAIFDILIKPAPELTGDDIKKVKEVVKDLILNLEKRQLIVLDWRKKSQTRGAINSFVKDTLDGLPKAFEKEIYDEKCRFTFAHIFENYYDNRETTYTITA
jgi:type I restriction enzyme, R subunit